MAANTRKARARRWALALFIGVAFVVSGPAHAADEMSPAWRAARQLMGAQLPSGFFSFEYDFLIGGGRPDTERGFGRMEYITREAGAA